MAKKMEAAGAEAAFVGTSGVVGAYTGLADVGVATMTECVTVAGFTHSVMHAALWDFMQDFQARGLAAWEAFQASRQACAYPNVHGSPGENAAKQQELEARYFPPALLEKYRRAPGSDVAH